MSETYRCRDVAFSLEKRGADQYTKTSYPLRYGVFSEIETPNAILQFNLNDEIIQARGKGLA